METMIKSNLKTKVVSKPFDQALKELEEDNYRVISLIENAQLRIQEDSNSDVSKYGNWTREGILYIPKKGNFLVRNSPILYSAELATDSHRNGKEFYPTNTAIEKALQDSVKFPNKSTEIPVNDFKNNPLTAYAFGENAEEYGNFLKEAGINAMPVWVADEDYVKKQTKPFARQMWFRDLGNGSGLGGYGDLDYGNGLRGVSESGEASAKNIKKSKIETYTPAQIKKVLKELKLSGLEESILSNLKSQ